MEAIAKNPKKRGGRTKAIMEKIEHPTKRLVTFSKRKHGIFSKASQLCTFSGAKIAILLFSPGSKVFMFGNPSADAVIDQYLSGQDLAVPRASSTQLVADHGLFNERYCSMALRKLAMEKQRKAAIDEKIRTNAACQDNERPWWEEDVPGEQMDGHDLEEYSMRLVELRKNVATRISELGANYTTNNQGLADHHHHGLTCTSSHATNYCSQGGTNHGLTSMSDYATNYCEASTLSASADLHFADYGDDHYFLPDQPSTMPFGINMDALIDGWGSIDGFTY